MGDLVGRNDGILPYFADLNEDIYTIRRSEGIIGLSAGRCPYFGVSGVKSGCNHCSLPIYSAGKVVSSDLLKFEIDSAFEMLRDIPGSSNIRSISMYNAGSAFNKNEFPRDALFHFFSKISGHRDEGVFPYLDRVSVESRETFVDSDLLKRAIDCLDGVGLEVAFGLESLDDRVRNGDADNSRGMIGLNKRSSIEGFESAVGDVFGVGADARFYVMMGSVPWLGERMVDDVLDTVDYLHGICSDAGVPTFIHLNPMYAARGSVLCDVWNEAILEGNRLPGFSDVVGVLEGINDEIDWLGFDNLYVCLGLSDEGLSDAERFGDEELAALKSFNRNQDLGALVEFRDFGRGGLDE